MNKRILAFGLSLAMVFNLGLWTNTEVYAAEDPRANMISSTWLDAAEARNRATEISMNEQELVVLYATNKIRMINGLEPLSTTALLQEAADIRGNELGTLFDHTRPDGTNCSTVLDQLEITYNAAGENIAGGRTDPLGTVGDWWNSPGHRRNMLSGNFTHIGVGYEYMSGTLFGNYWVQLFTGICTPESIRVMGDTGYIFLMPAGESLDTLGLLLEVECEHGTSYLPLTEEMCSGYDPGSPYTIQTVRVDYRGSTTDFRIYPYPPMQFSDVSQDSWYYGYVEYVYALNLMTGLNSTYFGAAEPLARAQFAVILYRLEGEPDVSGMEPETYPDVDAVSGDWYIDAVTWAENTGIITGYSNGNFGPGDHINREQMATIMYRYAVYKGLDSETSGSLDGFPDAASVSDFARDGMKWAVGKGIISGDNGRLYPQREANRAETATIINRFISAIGM